LYDIIAKLRQPRIFIRYNPADKNSDINILLKKVNGYLNQEYETQLWNDV